MRTGDSNLGVGYTQVLFNQAAPKGADGKPIMSQVLHRRLIARRILEGMLDQCDTLDGLKDGMIENVAQCRFEPAKLQCIGRKKDGCLSGGQVKALEKGLAGPRDKAGYPIYAPMAVDTGIMAHADRLSADRRARPLRPAEHGDQHRSAIRNRT